MVDNEVAPQMSVNPFSCSFASPLGLLFEAPLPERGELHMYFFVESTSWSSNFVLLAALASFALQEQ